MEGIMMMSAECYWQEFVRSFVEEIPAIVAWYAVFIIAFATAYATGPRKVIYWYLPCKCDEEYADEEFD